MIHRLSSLLVLAIALMSNSFQRTTLAFQLPPLVTASSSPSSLRQTRQTSDDNASDDADCRNTAVDTTTTTPTTSPVIQSVNYFISRACNYSCKFCFHTQKNTHHLPLAQAAHGLELLRQAGTEKINFAGGEPFLNPVLLGELCKKSHELGMAVSIISNGSVITRRWMEQYGEFVDVLGVSVDSFCPETNAAIGRGGDVDNNQHVSRMLLVRDLCAQHNINFKLNTVVCNWNWWEDMNQQIRQLEPMRWKVFQVLVLTNENSGGPGELRDARPLVVSDEHYWSFVDRHAALLGDIMIPEPNNVMQNSYLLLDEELRFLDCSSGGKVPSESILDVGVEQALQQSAFDMGMFQERGGIYDWKRERSKESHVRVP